MHIKRRKDGPLRSWVVRMFNGLFGKNKEEVIAEREALKKELLAELKKDAKNKKEAKAKIEAEADAKLKASNEPWVKVKGNVVDPEKGIKIELDWNDAFVKYLRSNGYKGADDDTVVQHYIAILSKQIADDLHRDQHNPDTYE